MSKTSHPEKQPRARDLPGMEDGAIAVLEELAEEYAETRDRRMALNAEEVDLKARVLREMQRLGRQLYKRNGIEIKVVTGEDDVKVKVAPAAVDETPEGIEAPPPPQPADPPPPEFDDPRDPLPPAPREEPEEVTH
jgi:hypothetical protein